MLAVASGCGILEWGTGARHDQAYYEDLAYQAAWTYDVVHGVAQLGVECSHAVQTSCPSGETVAPIRVDLDPDWVPESHRLDRSLPVLSTMTSQGELGVSGYIALGYFDGLQDDPDWTVVCDEQQAMAGWGNLVRVLLRDEALGADGIDHGGIRAAVERGASETTEPIDLAGGADHLDCAP